MGKNTKLSKLKIIGIAGGESRTEAYSVGPKCNFRYNSKISEFPVSNRLFDNGLNKEISDIFTSDDDLLRVGEFIEDSISNGEALKIKNVGKKIEIPYSALLKSDDRKKLSNELYGFTPCEVFSEGLYGSKSQTFGSDVESLSATAPKYFKH
ncbi:MAG: hypothetical protein WC758_00250 [Candidatus Woesearchaeota archaeon]|jgi:hypothetical protein